MRAGVGMGLMDKVKEQAAAAASVAKDVAQKGQAKVDEVQARRAADGVLRELGLAVYLTKVDRAPASVESDIERHVEAIRQYESEHGPLQPD